MVGSMESASADFEHAHGYVPDLDSPSSFSEKLFHRVRYEVDPLYALYTNKYFAPYYAASRAGPELEFADRYGVFTDLTVGDLERLPQSFVLKGSHASGASEIVPDREVADLHEIVRRLDGKVRHVRNAKGDADPGAVVLAEEFLVEPGQPSPRDFKFHCFHSPDRDDFRWILQVDLDRWGDHIQNIYDDELETMPFVWGRRQGDGEPFVPPRNFDRMVTVARRLSEDFDYIRVDLYNIDGRVVFGEITPFHQGGKGPITPREWDFRLGEMWRVDPDRPPRFSRQPRAAQI
jgi:hypothetical protein